MTNALIRLTMSIWLACLLLVFVGTVTPPWGLPFWLFALLHGSVAAAVTVKIWERRT